MKELSIFVDESGDFGPYENHSPYYLFTLIFHEQDVPIRDLIKQLEDSLDYLGLPRNHCFHAGPLIRREADYYALSVPERRKCLNYILSFSRKIDFAYVTIAVEKKNAPDSVALTIALTKQLSSFIGKHLGYFHSFERIVVYYDNGQIELNRLLASVFAVLLPQAEFKKVLPVDYRLFQVADLYCTLELISLKYEHHLLTRSEKLFFGSMQDMKRNYLKPMRKKRML